MLPGPGLGDLSREDARILSNTFSLEEALKLLDERGYGIRKQLDSLLTLINDVNPKVSLGAHKQYWAIMRDLYKMHSGSAKATKKQGKTTVQITTPTLQLNPMLKQLAQDNKHERKHVANIKPAHHTLRDGASSSGPKPDLPSPEDGPEDDREPDWSDPSAPRSQAPASDGP